MSYDGRSGRSQSADPRRPRPNRSDSDRSDAASPPRSGRPKSAMRDPSRQGPRSNSRVRVSDDAKGADDDDSDTGSIIGQYVKHRDGRIDYMPSSSGSKQGSDRGSGRPRDLEHKNDKSHHDFRRRRDGYESDEGDTLRGARRNSNQRHDSRRFDNDDDNRSRRGDDGRDDDRPQRRRPHPRGYQSDEDDAAPRRGGRDWAEDAALAGGGAAAAYGAHRAGKRGDDRRSGRGGGDYDDGGRRQPPQGRPSRRYDDRGYDSERPRRGRYEDEERLPRRRGGDGDRYGRSRYDEDPRYNDRLPQRSKSDRRSYHGGDERRVPVRSDGKVDWKKQGMGLFEEQLMPIIKKEGGRMAMKQLSKFLPS